MRKVLFFVLLVVVLLTVSCDIISTITSKQLSDDRFNGEFSYRYRWIASDGIDETYISNSLTFDGTVMAHEYYKYYSYTRRDGWKYSGNYIGDYYYDQIEINVDDGIYKYRFWGSDGDWLDQYPYTFNSDGSELTFHNYYYDGSSITYSKQ